MENAFKIEFLITLITIDTGRVNYIRTVESFLKIFLRAERDDH